MNALCMIWRCAARQGGDPADLNATAALTSGPQGTLEPLYIAGDNLSPEDRGCYGATAHDVLGSEDILVPDLDDVA